jgi:hypothetical protein
MDQAKFTGTRLYAGRLHHPQHGLIHVLGYQNIAVNLAGGPNAMLLHLPTHRMSQDNFISTERNSRVLERMVDAVKPEWPAPGGASVPRWGGAPAAVEVFEHDIYTVLLAADPTALPDALAQVPARKRPHLNPQLFQFYADLYPGYAIAVCCFDNAEAAQAEPLFLWYPPIDPEVLVVPAVDSHTGEPPKLNAHVLVDHWVILGTDEAPPGWGRSVDYGPEVDPGLREFLPDTVVGSYIGGGRLNGDFALNHDVLLAGDPPQMRRLVPN